MLMYMITWPKELTVMWFPQAMNYCKYKEVFLLNKYITNLL